MTPHATRALVDLSHGPQPRQEINPGLVQRLLLDGFIETVPLPSPYKKHKGAQIEHVRLTKAGHDAALASHKVAR